MKKEIKPLLKFTEEQIEQMSGDTLYGIYENHLKWDWFYRALAKKIAESNQFAGWVEQVFETTNDMELDIQLQFTLQRHILSYIKGHFKGLIEDRIYDHLDYQDMRKDPDKYYGCSKETLYGVKNA